MSFLRRQKWVVHPAVAQVAGLAVALAIAGCARVPANPPATPPSNAAKAAPQPAGPPATQPTTARAGQQTPSDKGNDLDGAIRRSELLWVHRQGPQQFIQQVRVKPSFRRGRFFGWRIVAYSGPGPVHDGDVIRRINGKPIERPEQFMAVWDNLPSQQELVVEMLRAGRAVTLRYPIVTD